jgi:hypothetical protein
VKLAIDLRPGEQIVEEILSFLSLPEHRLKKTPGQGV